MAAVTTIAAGSWSTGSTVFSGGSGVGGLPTAADTVTLTHAITQDLATAVCDALTMGAGGSLTASTSTANKLVVDKGITNANGSSNGIIYDMSSAPTVTAELYWNADRSASGYDWDNQRIMTLKGAAKLMYTLVSGVGAGGAISVGDDGSSGKELTAVAATGWRPGDRIIFCSTQGWDGTQRQDVLTLDASYTPGSTSLIFTSGMVHSHDGNCLVANYTRNVKIGPATAGDRVKIQMGVSSRAALMRDVEIASVDANYGTYTAFIFCNGSNQGFSELSNCAFYELDGCYLFTTNDYNGTILRQSNALYSTKSNAYAEAHPGQPSAIGPCITPIIMRANSAFDTYAPGMYLQDPMISGVTASNAAIISANTSEYQTVGGGIWSSNVAVRLPQGVLNRFALNQTRIGKGPSATANYPNANNNKAISTNGGTNLTLQDCPLNTTGGTFIEINSMPTSADISIYGKNADPAAQEVYYSTSASVPGLRRNSTAACVNRSTSSLEMKWTGTAGYARSRSFKILTKSGQPITLIGYFMKSGTNLPESGDVAYGSSTLPYVEISGLGITPVRITMSGGTAAGAWEKFEFLPGTATEVVQSSGADGELTVTFVGQSAEPGGPRCFFSGVPFAPFVTRARHYGYLFDETSPTRTANGTKSAAEATAAAYTGMTVTWGASSSSLAITADNTFQKVYDYTQAQACLNVGSALPLTGAGVAGSPALFAAGNVTISTGAKLNGNGSIAMDAHTLTTEFSDNGKSYTFTGGSWSQPTTVPTFSGGTLALSGEHSAYVFNTQASMVVSFAPTANAVTYGLGTGSYVGTLDLRNTHATRAITVELPSGTDYVGSPATTLNSGNSNNTGADITISLPVVHNYVQATVLTDTRVVLQNNTQDTEVDNVFISGTSYSYEITTEADDGDSMTLHYFKDGYLEGSTNFVWGAATQTVSVTQTVDPVEASLSTALGITGADVTEYTLDITGTVEIDADDVDGASLKARVALWYKHELTTENGARYLRGALSLLSDAAFRINVDALDLLFSNINPTTALYFTDLSRRLYRSDGTSIIAPVSYSIHNDYSGVPDVVETGVSGLTGAESAKLAAIPDAAANAAATLAAAELNPIAANMKQTNDVDLQGDGSEADKFRSVLVP